MARYTLATTSWDQFTASTSGQAELKVARLDTTASPAAATLLVDQHYTIAPASMRGTIYYWAINTGRVMRIKPGAADDCSPDDFLGPGEWSVPRLPHRLGERLAARRERGPLDSTVDESSVAYDLQTSATAGRATTETSGTSAWALRRVTPDGATLVENCAPLRGGVNGYAMGAFDVGTGMTVAGTGLDGTALWMPAFSPDAKLLAYVTSTAATGAATSTPSTGTTPPSRRRTIGSSCPPGRTPRPA